MASRLLVADDSITIQKIVSMAFESEDMEVEGVGDGQEAFDRIAEFKPDIVLADVDMPGLDGFELSAKIKQTPETSGIKVLLLASDFEDFDEQRYQKCGADNHISKPFKSDDIVAMVKGLLESSSGDDVVSLSESEIIEQLDDTEEASKISGNLKEPQEEPSLEELLESVEKLSTEEGETSYAEGEVFALTEDDLELPESVELSADNEALALSDEDLTEPGELTETTQPSEPLGESSLEPEEEPQLENDDDIMDQMIRGVEELKESVQPPVPAAEEPEAFAETSLGEPEDSSYADEPEIFAEVRSHKMEDFDDLDSAFKELAMGGRQEQVSYEESPPELSSLGGIVPEPEDLLERMAPGTFFEVGKRPTTPEDIKENLDSIAGFPDRDRPRDFESRNLRSRSWEYEAGDDRFTQAIAEEVRQVLNRSLGTSLEKEVFGLSGAILKTIREVVREVTPEIVRRVIREEIEKIKKQDMY